MYMKFVLSPKSAEREELLINYGVAVFITENFLHKHLT